MANYQSSYTGATIDDAVGKVANSGVTQADLTKLSDVTASAAQLDETKTLSSTYHPLGGSSTQDFIAQNLTVHNTFLTKDSQNVQLGDAIITLNAEEAGTPTENAGIEVERGTSTNVLLRWNETSDRWEFTNDGTTYYNIPISTEYDTYVSSDFTHDDLTGFVANEHIDHSTITLTAGTGLSGGGDITASRSFAVDLNELTTETTIADADFIAMVDATDNGSGKITFENLEDAIFASVSGDILITEAGVATIQANSVALATDTTGDYVSTITGGTGIDSTGATSGENISHTLSLDLNELTTETTIADADFIAMVDATDSGSGKITFAQFRSSIPSNNLFDGLADPNEDKIPYWKDGTGNPAWVTIGSGLSFSGGTLDTAAVTVDRFTKVITDESRPNNPLTAGSESDTLDFLGGNHISTDSSKSGSVVTITFDVDDASLDGRYYTESEMQTFFNRGYISKHSANNLAVGWYTIATNTGDRALGEFQIWDTASSDHQSVLFNASHHFGTNASNDITVLANSRYSGTNFRYIRIKENGTYDGAALQVYVDATTNAVNVAIVGGNAQESGWVIKDWIADAFDPGDVSNWSSFSESCKVDLDVIINGGIMTTGEIYSGGTTTQYRVLNTADEGSGNGLDADTLDSIQASSFLRSDAADSFSGKLTFTGSSDGINMANGNIVNVNNLTFNDPGVNEGLQWNGGNGWKIYESPNGLTNAAGNLQFVTTSTRRMTLDTSGNLDVTGDLTLETSSNSDSPTIALKNNGAGAYQPRIDYYANDNSSGSGLLMARISAGFVGGSSWGNARLSFGVGSGASDRMYIDGNGRVVIGTDIHPNGTRLTVGAGASGGNVIGRTTSSHHNWFPYTDGNNYYSAPTHYFRSSDHSTTFLTLNSTSATFAGNVNLATTSNAILNFEYNGSVTNRILNGSLGAKMYIDSDEIILREYGGSANPFLTLNSTSATFGGDVTLQNTGDATLWIRADTDNVTETDNATLRISQDGDIVNFYIGTDQYNGCYFQAYDYFAWKNSGGTERMRLTSAGELRCDADVIAYYSDARLKDFHGVIENPIEKIMKLNGYYFTENAKAKELGFDNDRMQVGVSAQEIEEVLPELIKDAPIGYGYKTIDYGKITPLLIEAIKEQQQQINELKRQIGEA